MHRKWLASVLTLTFCAVVILTVVQPVQAITFGEPDGDRHPNVGLVAAQDSDGAYSLICSGTLIAPTIFLTAAHCTALLAYLEIDPHNVWVSFDPAPTSASIYHRGTYDLNPNYGHDMGDAHDVAVIVLDAPVTGITPASLPTAGLLDQMQEDGTLRSTQFVAVGYGVIRDDKTGGPNGFMSPGGRRFATQSAQALKPAWIQFSMNPATGNGGTCYGDSGGPHFISGTAIAVAVTSTGDYPCRATDVTYRLDTDSARSYLAEFVTLP